MPERYHLGQFSVLGMEKVNKRATRLLAVITDAIIDVRYQTGLSTLESFKNDIKLSKVCESVASSLAEFALQTISSCDSKVSNPHLVRKRSSFFEIESLSPLRVSQVCILSRDFRVLRNDGKRRKAKGNQN